MKLLSRAGPAGWEGEGRGHSLEVGCLLLGTYLTHAQLGTIFVGEVEGI